jgi:CTD small phosphatase-like protein 2
VSGFFIKDLRIITNRGLKDIVMVDNLVHSFGLQLTNGIPILDFINNKNDK